MAGYYREKISFYTSILWTDPLGVCICTPLNSILTRQKLLLQWNEKYLNHKKTLNASGWKDAHDPTHTKQNPNQNMQICFICMKVIHGLRIYFLQTEAEVSPDLTI